MRRLPATVGLVLATVLAGCGTQAQTHAPAALSPAAYRAAATRSCEGYRRQVASLPAPSTVTGLKRYVAAMRRLVAQRIAGLRRLPPPPSMAAAVARMDGQAGPLVAALDRLGRSIRVGASPRAALAAFRATVARITPVIDAQWKALGVSACAA